MATITLYKDKLNGVGGLIDNIVKSSNNLDTQLGTLKSTLQGVSNSTYDLQDTVDNISSSSKTEKEKVKDLKKLNKKVTDFITTTVNRDNSARDEINKKKKDFYSKYSYLKPDCEKSKIEKIVDSLEKAAEWCAEHWKLIATAVIVVVAIVLIATGVGAGIGGPLLVGACWGAVTGAVIGGVAGGLSSLAQGGTFLDGFENGAFSGAIFGAISGIAFAGGGIVGAKLCEVSHIGKIIKGTAAVSKVISLSMAGFDMLALGDMAFNKDNNPIANINARLHSNPIYNTFQCGVSIVASFTGGAKAKLKNPTEFAQSWQGSGKYPGIDQYENVTIKKGTILYRGEPGGTEYFTTLDAIESSGRNAQKIFEGLQVEKNPIHGYRPEMKGYVFNKDIAGAYGITNANPQFGVGGLPQFFVPDIKFLIKMGIIEPVETITLIK